MIDDKRDDGFELLVESDTSRSSTESVTDMTPYRIPRPAINYPKTIAIQTLAIGASAASLPLAIIGSKASLDTLISSVVTTFLTNWWVGSESFGLDYSAYSKLRLGIALPAAVLITLPYGASTYLLAVSHKLLQGSADFAGNFSFNYYALVVIDYKQITRCALLPLVTVARFLNHLRIYHSLTDPSYYLYKARYRLLDNLKYSLRQTSPDSNRIANYYHAEEYSLHNVLQALIDSDETIAGSKQSKLWIAFKESAAWSFGLWMAVLAIEISCAAKAMFHVMGLESDLAAEILGQIVNLPNCVLSLKSGVAIMNDALDGLKDITEGKFTVPALWKLNAIMFLTMHLIGLLIPSRSGEPAVVIFESFCPDEWINDITTNNVRAGNLIFNWYFLNKTLNTLIDTFFIYASNDENRSFRMMTNFLERAHTDIVEASAEELVTVLDNFPMDDAKKLIGTQTYNKLSTYNFFKTRPGLASTEMKPVQTQEGCPFILR